MLLRSAGSARALRRRWYKDDGPVIKIGGVIGQLKEPKNPELVPRGYASQLSQDSLRHLRWLLQKDQLGQDAFLIGPPGPRKRWLSLAFAELTQREIEYLALSRDITETDIKQGRVENFSILEKLVFIIASSISRILMELIGIKTA